MENSRFSIGAIAADRPLLTATIAGLGLTALSVMGFAPDVPGKPSSANIAIFALHCLLALAAPIAAAVAAPAVLRGRIGYAAVLAAVIVAVVWYAPSAAPDNFVGYAPSLTTGIAAAGIAAGLIVLRPFFGVIPGLALVAPAAGLLGAVGAGGMLALRGADGLPLLGAVTATSAALATLIGIGVVTEFARRYASGASSHDAASEAGGAMFAPTINACLLSAGAFILAALVAPQQTWSLATGAQAAAGVAVACLSALLVAVATLSLANVSDAMAVIENHRRRRFRTIWRPVRAALPASSALAFAAITLITAMVALFEAFEPMRVVKLSLLGGSVIAAGLTFVSIRTGIFIFVMLFTGSVLIDWGVALAGTSAPSLIAEIVAVTCAAALYAHLALAARDARGPRRKPHEAAEIAMVDGAYGYILSTAITIAAFLVAASTGLWPAGGEAAAYFFLLALFGAVASAPFMTAISAVFGAE
ncbi:MAG: hypothetical protein AAF850_13240 [Pseudomonadota bacterium]